MVTDAQGFQIEKTGKAPIKNGRMNKAGWKMPADYAEDEPGLSGLLTSIDTQDVQSATLNAAQSLLLDTMTDDKRRSPRSVDELVDCSKPASAEVNKLHEKYQARVESRINVMVDEFRMSSGMTKRQITEQALEQFIRSYPQPK